jgi:hypothetical protein
MDLFSRVAEGDAGVFSMGGGVTPPGGLYKYARGLRCLDQANLLSLYAPLCDETVSVKTLAERASEHRKRVASTPVYYLVSRLFSPDFVRAIEWVGRSSARMRCARTAVAAEQYRLKHGRWPDSLEDLVPEFLDAIPPDPFADDPLGYLRTEEGVTVYSVGPDEFDDGGLVIPDPEAGSRRYETPDVGFRLLDPALRGFHVVEEADEPGVATE